ncbi:MAG TPA: hypothetical protein VJP85_13490 [Candidatus Baltobacteraceae bacterium]|nr:hypothetical protein [Candidatus Baltobacteraceae bacterium]
MRAALRRIPNTALAVYIGAVDATVWLAALPFEYFCRRIAAQAHEPAWVLLALLCGNVLLLAVIASAVVATGELLRRGLTRRVPVLLRVLPTARSRRSVR